MNPPSVVTALRRPTLRHLYNFVQQVQRAALPAPAASPPLASASASASASATATAAPSLHRLLTSSSSFLSSYLPPRLYAIHHTHHYHSYSLPLTSLHSFNALSALYHRLSVRDEWVDAGGGGGASDDAVERFGRWSARCLDEMEAAVRTLTHELRDVMAVAMRGESDEAGRARLQGEVNTLLDVTHSVLIEMRLHLSHYHYAHCLYTERPVESVAADFPLASRCGLRAIVEHTADLARGMCGEKYGDAPHVSVVVDGSSHPSADVEVVAVAAHVHFVLMELLKNSMKAVIDRYGVLQLHDAPPIAIALSASPASSASASSASGPFVGLRVTDTGVGLSPPAASSSSSSSPPSAPLHPCPASLFHYFSSSSPSPVDSDDWRYSRSFGSPMQGLGVGLPLCRLYAAEVYGGGVSVGWVPGRTEALVVLNQQGNWEVGRRIPQHPSTSPR